MPVISIDVTTVGTAGNATGYAAANVVKEGFWTKLVLPDLANTADITIAEEQPDGTFVTIWAKANVTAQVYPVQLTSYGDAGADSGQKVFYHVTGRLKVTIEQADAGTWQVVFGLIPV